jgi:hypothetical protein
MIPKQEILSIAKAVGLRPDTVEKDYVLSWVLFGIFKNSHLSKWILLERWTRRPKNLFKDPEQASERNSKTKLVIRGVKGFIILLCPF